MPAMTRVVVRVGPISTSRGKGTAAAAPDRRRRALRPDSCYNKVMRATEAGMPKRRDLRGLAGDEDRFDGEVARRILQRAAAEQQRLSNELADAYTFEELTEIAAEAGISAEALRAAVEADRGDSGRAAAGVPLAPDERLRRQRPAAERLKPGNWSMPVKTVVLTAGSIGFLGSLLLFPAFAESVMWVLLLFLIVLSVLIVLGGSPF